MKTFSYGFYDFIPETLEENHLYISMKYRSISHLCPCGCGHKIVTTLSPIRWKLTYDGESISLHPSVGNWELPCKSHYWIKNNNIYWANSFDDREIVRVRKKDQKSKKTYNKKRKKFLWW